MFDLPSQLTAIGLCGLCLVAIMMTGWVANSTERYLITCGLGGFCGVLNAFAYSAYHVWPIPLLATGAFACLLVGLSVLYGAARQFRTGVDPMPYVMSGSASVFVLLPSLMGYDGVGTGLFNLAAATLLGLCAREYWAARAESPALIGGLCFFYLLPAVSFLACAALIVDAGQVRLDGPLDNWAEHFNAAAGIIAVAGVGALTLALNQSRLAQQHRRDAFTDTLSGLPNRRALFTLYQSRPVPAGSAVLLLDIDVFKSVNDQNGHGVGDSVVQALADALNRSMTAGALAARLAGDEFVLVLPALTREAALDRAHDVRATFAALVGARLGIACAVSVGIAYSSRASTFEAMLAAADTALYAAKRGGRDRVEVEDMPSAPVALPRASA